MSTHRDPLTTMSDGTIKQVNPFSGTAVWTIPGRGNRPLSQPISGPLPLEKHAHTNSCAFCSATPLATPPEKSRIIFAGAWSILHGLLPNELDGSAAEFRRVPNLFEIISFDYWRKNYGFEMDLETSSRMERYLSDSAGAKHIHNIVRTRLRASNQDQDLPEDEIVELARGYFAGGHDVIISRRHFIDDATHDNQLASSGSLTPEEHYGFIVLTVDALGDLYRRNRYVPYVSVFQNWLAPAGASFNHLHKQLVAIDERPVQAELEISKLRNNLNMYNEWGVDYAGYHNLIVAENEHAVVCVGIGHRYPTLSIYSRSPTPEPWKQTAQEVRAMSDLIHACHAATGADIPSNEEWHHKPIDVDLPMPWRVNLKWRVSTLAGFEGGTRIYVNTLSPENIRDRTVSALYQLRDEGLVAQDIRIATECTSERNSLKYNPFLA